VRTDTIIAIDTTKKIILIGNSYAGEMKKSVFTTLNFYLPAQGVMPCIARPISAGTATSRCSSAPAPARPRLYRPQPYADRRRRARLGPDGVFHFEGGCYAGCIKLARGQPKSTPPPTASRAVRGVVFDRPRIPN
jgi:phosphoenolpyruvate carboxykinase (ATP)